MTLLEAIKHYEESARRNERFAHTANTEKIRNRCAKLAEDHKQLTEWLKELSKLREKQ